MNTQVTQTQSLLRITEIFQDSGIAFTKEKLLIDESVNVNIVKYDCWQPYWDERVCHVEVMPTATPAFVVFYRYRSVDTTVEYDEIWLYYFDGERHTIVMLNDYSWY